MKRDFKKNEQKGFTLVEMIVSIGIFTVVLTLAVGSLMSILDGYGKAQALGTASNNINLVMEEMTRNIMQGNKYHCDINDLTVPITDAFSCPGAGSVDSMAFHSFRGGGQTVKYWLDNSSGSGVIWKEDNSGPSPLTSSDVINIESLDFYVFENETVSTEQPRVVIILKGEIPGGEIGDEFIVQTSVTERAVNQQS